MTHRGRELAVVYEMIDAITILPVTAFELDLGTCMGRAANRATIRKRIRRPLSAAERSRHREIIAEVEQSKASLVARGRSALALHDRLQEAVQALKAKRQERGLSLTELQRLSGIDRARLSRLESNPDANPTIETLSRIASALGVEIRVAVVDAD